MDGLPAVDRDGYSLRSLADDAACSAFDGRNAYGIADIAIVMSQRAWIASDKPSPTKLKAITVKKIPRPGNNPSHQA